MLHLESAAVLRPDADDRIDVERISRCAVVGERAGEVHRQAAGVCRRQHVLRAGVPVRLTDTGGQRQLHVRERPDPGGYAAFTGLEVTFPNRACAALSDRHASTPSLLNRAPSGLPFRTTVPANSAPRSSHWRRIEVDRLHLGVELPRGLALLARIGAGRLVTAERNL